jgi:hypothetical protein
VCSSGSRNASACGAALRRVAPWKGCGSARRPSRRSRRRLQPAGADPRGTHDGHASPQQRPIQGYVQTSSFLGREFGPEPLLDITTAGIAGPRRDDVSATASSTRATPAAPSSSPPRRPLVGVEVALLLLVRTGAEGERPVVPDSPQRNSVRATVSADGDDPIELGVREQGFDVLPRWCDD